MADEHIFVIEDDDDLRNSIIEVLSENEFEVEGFASSESAMNALQKRPPQIVIVDNMMPGMNGMTFMPLARKKCPGIKILMITAFATIDNAVAAMRNGADDYLVKPFKINELLVAVRRSIEELTFEKSLSDPDVDTTLLCLSNQIRRRILQTLAHHGTLRFMDITRKLDIDDHTKVNFHLRNLKLNNLIQQDEQKRYSLTDRGLKLLETLLLLTGKP